jgi:hypothetical protein
MQQQTHINLPSTPSSATTSSHTRSAFPRSVFVALPATLEEHWSLFHRLDQLIELHFVMNINEKKYGLPLAKSMRRRTT